MNNWLQLFRGATRPIITLLFTAAFIYASLTGNGYSEQLGVLTSVAVTWWFSDRSKKEPDGPSS
jgi:hypothetical protein